MRKVVVIVFGDIERSPRTLNHAHFLNEAGFAVHIIGFSEKDHNVSRKFTLHKLVRHGDGTLILKILCYLINLIILVYYLATIKPFFVFLQVLAIFSSESSDFPYSIHDDFGQKANVH